LAALKGAMEADLWQMARLPVGPPGVEGVPHEAGRAPAGQLSKRGRSEQLVQRVLLCKQRCKYLSAVSQRRSGRSLERSGSRG
jgi:hypothetical protein